MTDIYIRRNKSSKGCLHIVVLGVALVAVLVAAFLLAHKRMQEQPPAPEPDQAASLPSPTEAQPLVEEEPVPEPVPEPAFAEQGPTLLADARALLDNGDLSGAREKLLQLLAESRHPTARKAAEETLSDISIKLVMTPRPMPEKVDYTIKSGDTLGKLADDFGTTVELIRKGNNISGSLIRIGDRYRILNGRFSIKVDRSDNTLDLYLNDRFFKRYRVGTGKFEKTPIGEFKITDRIAQPTWWRPDGKSVPYGSEENVLGTHWLSLDIKGYGIHGTWEPETIGKQASAGCIRLLNEDIEELYTLVPIGTPVVITE